MKKLYLAVNPDGTEVATNNFYGLFRHHKAVKGLVDKFGKCYDHCYEYEDKWCDNYSAGYYTVPRFTGVVLAPGTIKFITGKDLTWDDEPEVVELGEINCID